MNSNLYMINTYFAYSRISAAIEYKTNYLYEKKKQWNTIRENGQFYARSSHNKVPPVFL